MRLWNSATGIFRSRSGFATVAQTGLATGLVLLLNIGTGVVSARFLGPQGRGELAALMLCPQLLCFLFTFGLPSSVIVLARRDQQGERALLGAALALSAVAGLLAAIAGVLLLPKLAAQYSPQIRTEAQWLLLFVFLGTMQSVLGAGLQLGDRFGTFNRARCWQTAGILLCLLLLVVTHRITPLSAALAYLVPALPFFIWNAWWFLRELRPSLAGFAARSRELLWFGARIHVVDAGNTLFSQLDKLILVGLLAPGLFGTYVVVFNLSRLITTFGGAVVPVLLPRAVGKPVPEMLEATSKALVATAVLNAGALLGYVLFGRLVLGVVYGAQFTAGYLTLVILSAEAALSGLVQILQQPYLMLGRPGIVAIVHVVSLAAGGVLMYLLGSHFGMEGAACGLLAATALRVTLTHLGYRRVLHVAAPRMVPARRDWHLLGGRIRGAA